MTEQQEPTFTPGDEAAMFAVAMRPSEWTDTWRAINRDLGQTETDTAKVEKEARKIGGSDGLEQLIESRSGLAREEPEQPKFSALPMRLQVELTRRQMRDAARYR
jgi:hypothetical protein